MAESSTWQKNIPEWIEKLGTWQEKLSLQEDVFAQKISNRLSESISLLKLENSTSYLHFLCINNGIIIEFFLAKLAALGRIDKPLKFVCDINNKYEKVREYIVNSFSNDIDEKKQLRRFIDILKPAFGIRNQYSHASGLEKKDQNNDIKDSMNIILQTLESWFEKVGYKPIPPSVEISEQIFDNKRNGNVLIFSPINHTKMELISPRQKEGIFTFDEETMELFCSATLKNDSCKFRLKNVYQEIEKIFKFKHPVEIKRFSPKEDEMFVGKLYYCQLETTRKQIAQDFKGELLPPGLEVNNETGEVSGKLLETGTYPVKFSALDEDGYQGVITTVNFKVKKPPLFKKMKIWLSENRKLQKQYPGKLDNY